MAQSEFVSGAGQRTHKEMQDTLVSSLGKQGTANASQRDCLTETAKESAATGALRATTADVWTQKDKLCMPDSVMTSNLTMTQQTL